MNNIVIKEEDIKTRYKATGYCIGNAWGGGRIAYQSVEYKADTMEELKVKVDKGIENGSIDSGMGFESVVGALMFVTKEKSILIGTDTYVNFTYSHEVYGDVTEEEIEVLFNN